MLKISEQKKKKLPYFSDVLLFKRVDKYLDDNIDKQMIDKDAMVDELRETYKEYQRRNRSAFRVAVFKAYNMINQNILEVTQERSNDGSDVEAVDEQASQVNSSHQMDPTTPGSVANMLQTYLQGINSMASPAGSRLAQREQEMRLLENKKRMLTPIPNRQSKNPNNELINISSDEEGDEEPPAKRPSIIQSRDLSSNPRRVHHQQQMFRSMQKPHPSEANVHHVAQGLRMFNAVLPDVNTPSPHNQQPRRDEDPRRKKTKKMNYPALSIFPAEKRNRNHLPDTVPEITFADFGGYPKVLQAVSDLVLHFYQSDVYSMLGVTPPRGFLLHGPPGCGKTLLAHAIAGELNLPLVKASGPELIGGISGESEERIRKMFQQAKQQVPCILFIDEIDVISQTRENARKDMERRIVSQLIVSLDELNTCDEGEELIVIGATNRVEELDPGLRRAGRFDKEVCIGIPDRNAREGILRVLCRFLKMSSEISIEKIAELTPGFVAADLKSLISDAAVVAVKRVFDGRSSKARESRNSQPTIVNEEPINIVDDDKSESMAVDNVTNKTESEDASKNADKAVKVADEVKIDDGFDEADNDKTEDAVKDENKLDGVNDSEKAKSDEVIENEALNEEGERLENGCGSPNEDTKDDVAEKIEGGGSESVESPKTAKKSSLEESTVMDVDDTSTSNDLAIVPVVKEVVENGVGEEDQKSEDMDACVIIEEAVKTVNASVENTPVFKSNIAQSGYQDKSISIQIEMSDLLAALKTTQPSSKREGFATVPDVTWDDIGSLKDVRNELTMSIMMPVKYPDEFSRMGIDAPSGIMLWGPPGCGKTLLAKAIANEANINFISVKGPELLNMYVGESEKAVRTCFARARNSQPCVIFFDEIDALCPRRSDSSEGSVSSRVVNQVLTEMDGVEGRHGVFLMAASNRPDMVDPAVLRPGRLDKIVKVGLPNAHDRIDILKAITKNGTKPPLDKSVSLDDIGSSSLCDGYSGADLAALVKEASILALTEYLNKRESSSADQESIEKLYVNERHFIDATKKIKPSVHAEERKRYERLEKSFAAASAP